MVEKLKNIYNRCFFLTLCFTIDFFFVSKRKVNPLEENKVFFSIFLGYFRLHSGFIFCAS